MFTTLVVKPIFNLLVLIYGILPGHNFGLALIIFTIVIRLLMWPIVRRQLHQTKAMRKLQPEIKKIKQQAKGDRQKEMAMTMELYKERGISQGTMFSTLILQFIVLIGLYSGLRRVIDDPHAMVTFAYTPLQHLPWMKELSHNIHLFDNTLFGLVDLSRSAVGKTGTYLPALIIAVGSAVTQYYQSKQLLPSSKDARKLRDILKSAGEGTPADQSEVNAAVSRSTIVLFPVLIFITTINFAAALALYWFVGGLVAYIQQARVLRDDEEEMESLADAPSKKDVAKIPEAEIIAEPKPLPKPKNKKQPRSKRRKKK